MVRYGNTKSRWQQPPGCDGGQSSHHTWNSQPQVRWKEISAEVDAVRTIVKEKTSTWNKSCKEIVKSELELYKMVEAAVKDEKLEYKRKRNDQGSAAGLSDEMQRNLGEAQNRSYEVERKLDRVLRRVYLKHLTKNWDAHSSLWQTYGRWCRAGTQRTWTWTKTLKK